MRNAPQEKIDLLESVSKFLAFASGDAKKNAETIKALLPGRIVGTEDLQRLTNERNAEEAAAFKKLFSSNLLFYLTVIGNYALFKRYWLKYTLSDEEYAAIFAYLQKKYHALHAPQPLIVKSGLTHKQIENITNYAHFLLNTDIHQKMLNDLMNYWKLQEEVTALHRAYQHAQQKVITHHHQRTNATAAIAHQVFQEMHVLAERAPQTARTVIHPLIEPLKRHFETIRVESDAIEAENQVVRDKLYKKPDGSDDIEAKTKDIEQIRAKMLGVNQKKINFSELVSSTVTQLQSRSGEVEEIRLFVDKLLAIKKRNDEDVDVYNRDMKAVDEEFLPKIAVLEKKLKELEVQISSDNVKYLDTLIGMVKECRHENLPIEQRKALDTCVAQLNTYKLQISDTKNIKQQQAILEKCAQSLSSLQDSIQHSIDKGHDSSLNMVIPIFSSILSLAKFFDALTHDFYQIN